MTKKKYKINVNGKVSEVFVEPDEKLLWVIREHLGLTGTKFGCGQSQCNACLVLINGKSEKSCMKKMEDVKVTDRIITVEGLAKKGVLSPLQKSFIDHNAFACGFCTPGMLIRATDLLHANVLKDRHGIISFMEPNLCRCGTYLNIVEAIEAVLAGKYGKY